MKIQKMTIGGKLVAAFSLILLFLLLTTALGIYRLWQSQSQIEKIIGVNNAKVKLTLSMRDTVYERMLAIRTAALVGEIGKMQDEAERIAREETKYRDIAAALATVGTNSATSEEESRLHRLIQGLSDQCAPLIKRSIELSMAGQDSMAYDLLTEQIIPIQTQWMKALGDLVALEDKFSAQEARHSEIIFKETLTWLLTLGTLALASGVTVAYSLTRHITKQLGGEPGYAVCVAERISAGDLATPIDIKPADKVSVLYAMQRMLTDLKKMISVVRRDCEHIAQSSMHIAHGNNELSNRTEKQAAALEETSAAMKELTSTVKENAESAQQANDKAVFAASLAERGGRAVSEVVNTMSSIDTSSRKIVDIIGIIDSIAFQTNILALNAAVEAARAGAHGSGFAVVATEVRNLAQRSSSAAKEIAVLIKASNQQIETGNHLAVVAGGTMQEIVTSIQEVLATIQRISVASREQSEKIQSTNQAVLRLDAMTQENVTLVETIAHSAGNLQDRTKQVAEIMDVFKIDVDEPIGVSTPDTTLMLE